MEATMTTDMKGLAAQMLTENTGGNIVDSGGIYGRAWQRNQGRDFEAEPSSSVTWSVHRGRLSMCATISLYHWLVLNFEPDAEMQAKIDTEGEIDDSRTWFDIAEEVAKAESTEADARRTYTYNESDNWDLSQDVQFWEVYTDDNYEPTHLIVMVHNGCDARWGFTKPYALRIKGEDHQWRESARIDAVYAGDHAWYQEGGYNSGWVGSEPGVDDFFTLPIIDETDLGDGYDERAALIRRQMEALDKTTLTPDKRMAYRQELECALVDTREVAVTEKLDELEVDMALIWDGVKSLKLLENGIEYDVTVGNMYL
jgi:hypothetical protein